MQGKFNFIKLQKVVLRNFSLYSKKGKSIEVNEVINEGVYCLAGANGLGKTTFLNAINYGLTGIVLEPNKEAFSPAEIVDTNKVYTKRYFSGRIKDKGKEDAEIEILFTVNSKHFRIVRGFFEREELRTLEIFSSKDGKNISHFSSDKKSPKELNQSYQKLVIKEAGFDSFDYFLFYQLYILTFDENRRMIFWDDRASSHAMAIAFNADPEDANRTISIKREMDRHESLGRNARWQATQLKNRIEAVTNKAGGKKNASVAKIQDQHEKLFKKFDKLEKSITNAKIEYDTFLKNQSYLNSEIMQLKQEHARLFSRYSKPRSKLLQNPYIKLSIKKHECCLCGSAGTHVVETIEKTIQKDSCPLCNTTINEGNNVEQAKLLKQIEKNDREITEKNSELEGLILSANNKNTEIDELEYDYNKVKESLSELEEDYPEVSLNRGAGKNTLLDQFREQYKMHDSEAKAEYNKRDKLLPEYQRLLKKVEAAYKNAEVEFVPIFKKLAKSFIGLDLNISPKRTDKSIKLIIELQGTARTEAFQLSESQRFFLDIALRMALSIYLSKKGNEATMLIDTPEGSLDIAYESRVGKMFAEFVTDYKQSLLMTANINASQLLVSLAEQCGRRKMKFKRMLEWTDLTPIQREGEHLFEKVYSNIETALNKRK